MVTSSGICNIYVTRHSVREKRRQNKRWEDNMKDFNARQRAAEDRQRRQKIVADVSSDASTHLVVTGHR